MGWKLRWSWYVLATLVSFLLVWWNIEIHRCPMPGSKSERQEVKGLLTSLRVGMHEDVPERMQQLFPEGEAFCFALYGLANCHASKWEEGSDGYARIAEASWSLGQLESDRVRGRFPELLPPGNGIFYAGWSALLRGSIIEAVGVNGVPAAELKQFKLQCDSIAATFVQGRTPFPESYNGSAWPADGTVAMVTLVLHDRILPIRYGAVRREWIDKVKTTLPELGGMAHAWDERSNSTLREMRGSSLALICTLLPQIDSVFAKAQFAVFARNFFAERMGVPVVTEYPYSYSGEGDVDSGPLIFGAGPVAMIMGAGACRANGDAFHDLEFSSTIDAFGFVVGREKRKYLFGAIPIADLFIAWCRSMPSKNGEQPVQPHFLRFHGWSALLFVLMWSPPIWWWVRTPRKNHGKDRRSSGTV